MDDILIYALQVNLLLVIVNLGYVVLLKNLTFYQLNRFYLVSGISYAFIYPFLDIKSWFRSKEVLANFVVERQDFTWIQQPNNNVLTLQHVLVGAMVLGAVAFLIKLFFQFISLYRVHRHSEKALWHSYFFRNVLFPVAPFSFFNQIYVHREHHRENELDEIFKHEDVHVKGKHTFDVLFMEIVFILCWYNPFVWLLRKALRQNLEFLTDQQVLNKGVDRQVYQYSLLNVSKQGMHSSITNQFNFKMLKRRIMMMNKIRSSRIELGRYAFLLPIFILTAGSFTVSKADDNIRNTVSKIEEVSVSIGTRDKDSAGESGLNQLKAAGIVQDTIREKLKGEISAVVVTKDTTGLKRVRIAGVKSKDGKDPLYVVDGVVLNDREALDKINPHSIKSIDVLKPESGTALYGEKGANGVILITIKATDRDTTTSLNDADVVSKGKGDLLVRNGKLVLHEKEPLIMVDGVKQPKDFDIKSMDKNDIESIDIIKDAKAIEGDEGKNGVIKITTKSKSGSQEQDNVRSDKMMDGVTVIGFRKKDEDGTKASAETKTVDVQPVPKGGLEEFRKWVATNYQYPTGAIENKVKGTVLINFIVEKDGSLSNIKVIKDLGYGTGEAGVEAIKKAPNWTPGSSNGKPFRASYTFPIRLDLSGA